MANLEESAVWTPGVYQLETTDPVLGGPVQPAPATGGIANRAALALANRTVYLKAQVELKANINNPTFTGTPKAPTPATGDNSTKLATTAYVQTVVSQGYAPASHPHTIADVTGLQAELNGKLSTSGGTLTGNLGSKGFFIANATENKNAVLFLRDAAGNNRGNIFWDRISDKVQMTRYHAQDFTTEGWARINANNTFQTSHAIHAPVFNGNATSATKLATSPTINGTSFNGTANITTARWGAERTLTVGNKSQVVNGSANVTWTLADIGAAATSHTHAWAAVTGKPAQATRWPKWGEVTEKPASFGAAVVTLATLPASDIGPVIVADVGEVWVWVSTAHYTGYRSPLCGRPLDGHTVAPLPSEIDAVGGLLSKADYAGLWGYAQENSLVVTQAQWTANIGAHWFVDVSGTQFRVPDLRNQFRRYTGTDADSANERALGNRQGHAVESHKHAPVGGNKFITVGTTGFGLNSYSGTPVNYNGDMAFYGGAETRPANFAVHPRIHV